VKTMQKELETWLAANSSPMFWLSVFGVLALIAMIDLYVNWRLFNRMGYPPIWSLFLWVPVVAELVWMGLAFWRWPKQKS
jgi:hypothetical protein